MNVLFVHNRYAIRGGEDRAVDLLLDGLSRRGVGARLFSVDNRNLRGAGSIRKLARALAMPFAPDVFRALREKIRSEKPDVVHFHNVYPAMGPAAYWAARAERVPAVLTLHNYRFACVNGLFLRPDGSICERCHHGSFMNGVRFRCHSNSAGVSAAYAAALAFQRATRTLARAVDFAVAPSPYIRERFVETGFPADRVRYVAPLCARGERPAVRPKARHVLFVGRLSREKGVATLIRAYERIPLPLVVAGEGDERPALQDLCAKLGRPDVRFVGGRPREEIQRLMAEAALVVVPSEWYENMPFVLLEAWSAGAPVLASRVGALAAMIREGETGFLFKMGDAADLSTRLRTLLGQPAMLEAMRPSIEAHFDRNYDEEASFAALLDVYRAAIERRLAQAAA